MNTDDRMSGRRIGRLFSPALVSVALLLGACGSESPETTASDEPDGLALDTPVASNVESSASTEPVAEAAVAAETDAETDAVGSDATFDIAEFASLADLEAVELTPELFEQLKTNDAARDAIIVEMQNQGLDLEQSECFLDSVSPGLFIAFGTGEQPDDAQFGELLGLLDTCQIAFGS